MNWFSRLIFADLNTWLNSLGVLPETISYISSLPAEQKKIVQKWLGKNPQAAAAVNTQQIQQYLSQTQQFADQLQGWANQLRIELPLLKEWLKTVDPNDTHRMWILPRLSKDFRLEDKHRLRKTLQLFDANKNTLPQKDIFQYQTLHDLERALEAIGAGGFGSKRGGYLQVNPLSLPGVKLSLQTQDRYSVFEVTDPASLEKLGLGTKWCTREDYDSDPILDENGEEVENNDGSMAEYYIQEYGTIFVVTKDNKPYIQFTPDKSQVMDVNDQKTELPESVALTPQFFSLKVLQNKPVEKMQEFIPFIKSLKTEGKEGMSEFNQMMHLPEEIAYAISDYLPEKLQQAIEKEKSINLASISVFPSAYSQSAAYIMLSDMAIRCRRFIDGYLEAWLKMPLNKRDSEIPVADIAEFLKIQQSAKQIQTKMYERVTMDELKWAKDYEIDAIDKEFPGKIEALLSDDVDTYLSLQKENFAPFVEKNKALLQKKFPTINKMGELEKEIRNSFFCKVFVKGFDIMQQDENRSFVRLISEFYNSTNYDMQKDEIFGPLMQSLKQRFRVRRDRISGKSYFFIDAYKNNAEVNESPDATSHNLVNVLEIIKDYFVANADMASHYQDHSSLS